MASAPLPQPRPPTIEPQTLRAFVAVAREGNVTRAATRLHLSQPAVSLQLRTLAEATGLQLFTRTPQGMALTRDGAALLPLADRALAALSDFGQAAAALHQTVRGMVDGHFDFELATSLREARARVALERFDVVMLDIGLPNESGWDLLPDIRAHQPGTRVVVLTGAALAATFVGNRIRQGQLACVHGICPAETVAIGRAAHASVRGDRERDELLVLDLECTTWGERRTVERAETVVNVGDRLAQFPGEGSEIVEDCLAVVRGHDSSIPPGVSHSRVGGPMLGGARGYLPSLPSSKASLIWFQ